MDDFDVKVDKISNEEVLDYLGEVAYWSDIEGIEDIDDEYGNDADAQLKIMAKTGWNIQNKARNLAKCFTEIKKANSVTQKDTINKKIAKLAYEINPFLEEYLGFVDSFPVFNAMIVKIEDEYEEDAVADSMGIEITSYSENLMDYCERCESSDEEIEEEYLDDFIELSNQVSSCGELVKIFANMICQQHNENIIEREMMKK